MLNILLATNKQRAQQDDNLWTKPDRYGIRATIQMKGGPQL